MIPDTTLAEIRSRIDLVALISEYLTLKKSGTGVSGLCPFHSEKTGSFHVHPDRQIFHCFGCGKGGNCFTFFMEIEGLNFIETVKELAKRTGVEIPTSRNEKKAPATQSSKVLDALEWAAKYYHFLLMENAEYKHVKDYVIKRGLSEKTIRKFRLGASPKAWGTLKTHMLKRGFTLKQLNDAGLVVTREDSKDGGYDRFRERLMFPIGNPQGQVIGFGARLLSEEKDQPKYLNSSDSPVFSKRHQLYGLHENTRGIRLRGEAIIVEGYMDVIGLYESGVQNAVATMGTALSPEHCQLLKSVTQKVVTVFDPDSAGMEASKRSISLFLEAGIFAKDLTLPDGQDPDEYVLKHNAEKFYELCEKAPRQITKMIREIASQGMLTAEQTSKVLGELTPILRATRQLHDRAVLWDDLALVLNLSMERLKEIAMSDRPGKTPLPTTPTHPTNHIPASPQHFPKLRPRKIAAMELEFLQTSLDWPDAFRKAPAETWRELFKDPEILKVLNALATSTLESDADTITQLISEIQDPHLQGLLSGALVSHSEDEKISKKHPFEPYLERLLQMHKELEIRRLVTQVKLSQRLGDTQEQLALLQRLKDLRSS